MSSRLLTLMRKRGFNPLSLSPTLWALPSRSFSDNGVTPAVNNDPAYSVTNPGSWSDLLQETLAFRPLYKSAGYWTFDGSNDRLVATGSLGGLSGATVIGVVKFNDANANQQAINCNASLAALQQFSGAKYVYAGNGIYGSYADTNLGWNILVSRYDGAGSGNAGRLRAYQNGGTQKTLSFTGTVPATLGAGSGDIWIGGLSGASAYHLGDIAEMLVVPSALTDSQINQYANDLVRRLASLSLSWTDI